MIQFPQKIPYQASPATFLKKRNISIISQSLFITLSNSAKTARILPDIEKDDIFGSHALPNRLRCLVSIFLTLSAVGNSSGIVTSQLFDGLSNFGTNLFVCTICCIFSLNVFPAKFFFRLRCSKKVCSQFGTSHMIPLLSKSTTPQQSYGV